MVSQNRPPTRRKIFFGTEGKSEQSFVKWLQLICDESNLHLHLDVVVCGGGDSYAIAENSISQYQKKTKNQVKYDSGFILLDADRLHEDISHNRDPQTVITRTNSDLALIYLEPNFEGLLFRLFSGNENLRLYSKDTLRQLKQKRYWPEYSKPCDRFELMTRFSLADLIRVSKYDKNIRIILKALNLL